MPSLKDVHYPLGRKTCPVCGVSFNFWRSQARYCGATCRQRISRATRAATAKPKQKKARVK